MKTTSIVNEGGFQHVTVLQKEAVEALNPRSGAILVDGTLGGGGHSELLLEGGATVIGIDMDPEALKAAAKRLASFGKKFRAVKGNFRDLPELISEKIDGLVLDLGVSSHEFDTAERGFSFRLSGPLDMRFSPDQALTAAEVVNSWPEDKLEEIFRIYGEDRFARRIAGTIVAARKVKRLVKTDELAELIKNAVPGFARHQKIHPATRVFQALRIVVNDELGALEDGLKAAEQVLKSGGRLAVISFHSLEDRIVKRFLKSGEAAGRWRIISKKPIVPNQEEVRNNARARSAKLRIAERIGE